MPVSTRTRPDGVSMSRQLSAWRRRCSASISSVTRLSQRSRGHRPEQRPGVGAERAGLDSATRVPPPRSVRQSTASLMRHRRSHVLPVEVPVEGRGGRLLLALVARPQLRRAVRPLDRRRHPEERDLADAHAVVERDGQVRDVRQLERQVALPARIDVAGGRVDQQPEPAQRARCPPSARRGRPAARPIRGSGRARTRPGAG